ncbi:MAG: hypothetical protein HS132_14300 [Planctomycetia bacterium]|nr:hypothetical protein [Planctomycetia bacterium]
MTTNGLLMHIGALKKEAGRDFGLVCISLPEHHEPVNENTFCFKLDRERLLRAMSREGRYLLRSNMKAASPETAWEFYLLLTRVEQAFKDLKGTLSIRPIWHQLEERIEAHMIDVHLPTTDGRHVVMSRYTQPEKDVSLLLAQLGLSLPDQPPPKAYATGQTGL